MNLCLNNFFCMRLDEKFEFVLLSLSSIREKLGRNSKSAVIGNFYKLIGRESDYILYRRWSNFVHYLLKESKQKEELDAT